MNLSFQKSLIIFSGCFLFIAVFFGIRMSAAATLSQQLAGRILLQVEARGEAWYVNPADGMRYYLKNGVVAFEMLRKFGLGISNKDFVALERGNADLVRRLRGRILLKVEDLGKAYYVHPVTGKTHYMKDGPVAYGIMRNLSLGITNANLGLIPVGTIQMPMGCAYQNPACSANQDCVSNRCVLKLGCAYQNPSCVSGQECINNQCSIKSGCAYQNPSCDLGFSCITNRCVRMEGCAYDNPVCSSGYSCVNNVCVRSVADCLQRIQIAPSANFLIIDRPMFSSALQPFIAQKRNQGKNMAEVFLDDIVCGGQGNDAPEKVRNYLAQLKQRNPALKHVLIVGTPLSENQTHHSVTELTEAWEFPVRYIQPRGQYTFTLPSIPTDQYYASVASPWNTSDNSWVDTFSFTPDFFVGRIPLKTVQEVAAWVQKTTQWVPPAAPKHSLFVSNSCASHGEMNPSFLTLRRSTHSFAYHNCSTDNGGDIAALASSDAADYVTSMSHGSYRGVVRWPSLTGYEMSVGGPGFSKKNPFVFIHGCEVGGMDYESKSLGQDFIGRSDGAVGFIGASRSHWDIEFPFWQSVFLSGNLAAGEALYSLKSEIAQRYLLSYREIDNLFMFNLFGDPELVLAKPAFFVHRNQEDAPYQTSLSARIVSSWSEAVSGTLEHVRSLGEPFSVSQPVAVQPSSDVLALVVSQMGGGASIDTAHETYAFPEVIGFSGCDFSKMSCTASRVVRRARLPFTCGRVAKHEDVKSIRVRFAGSRRATKFVLAENPGHVCRGGLCPGNFESLSETTMDAIAGTEAVITWTKSVASEPLPAISEVGVSYINPSFKLAALDEQDNEIGYCVINAYNEPLDLIR